MMLAADVQDMLDRAWPENDRFLCMPTSPLSTSSGPSRRAIGISARHAEADFIVARHALSLRTGSGTASRRGQQADAARDVIGHFLGAGHQRTAKPLESRTYLTSIRNVGPAQQPLR